MKKLIYSHIIATLFFISSSVFADESLSKVMQITKNIQNKVVKKLQTRQFSVYSAETNSLRYESFKEN